jgi:hypothetical protein
MARAIDAETPVATKLGYHDTKLSVHSKYRLSTTQKKKIQGVVSLMATILLFCPQKLANTLLLAC